MFGSLRTTKDTPSAAWRKLSARLRARIGPPGDVVGAGRHASGLDLRTSIGRDTRASKMAMTVQQTMEAPQIFGSRLRTVRSARAICRTARPSASLFSVGKLGCPVEYARSGR